MYTKVIFTIVLSVVARSLAINCPGCPISLDVESPSSIKHLRQHLSESELIPNGSDSELVTPIKLIKATSQVVSGVKYTYDFDGKGQKTGKQYFCHIVVVSKPWIIEKGTILEYTCTPQVSRNKRSLPGAEFEVSLNDIQDLGDMGHLITKKLEEKQQTQYAMGIVKFLKATRQIVSGFLTKLTVEVAETNCLSADAKPNENCVFKKEDHQICDVHIWDQPWKQKKEVTELECNEKPQYCAGCIFETSANDKSVSQSLERTLFNLNTQFSTHWNLHKINKVKYQVVAGVKYMIEFEAENETKSLFNCTVVLVLQPWLSEEPSIEEFDCKPSSHME